MVVSLLVATGLIEEVHEAYPLDLENIHYNYAKEWNNGMKVIMTNDEHWMSVTIFCRLIATSPVFAR